MTALQQHSKVLIHGLEPVDHDADILANETRAVEHAEKFFETAAAQGKAGGFKIRPRHFTDAPKQWMDVIRKHDTRIILNFRNNLLKQAIGHYPIKFLNSTDAFEGYKVDANSSTWTGSENTTTNKRLLIENMEGLAQVLRDRIIGEEKIFRALGYLSAAGWDKQECTLPVSYEGFLMDWKASIERIQEFLGLDTKEVHMPLRRKVTEDNLCELLENYADVCSAFFGCQQLRWMLDDPVNNCMCSRLVTTKEYATQRYCP
jgi:hypothetical protein